MYKERLSELVDLQTEAWLNWYNEQREADEFLEKWENGELNYSTSEFQKKLFDAYEKVDKLKEISDSLEKEYNELTRKEENLRAAKTYVEQVFEIRTSNCEISNELTKFGDKYLPTATTKSIEKLKMEEDQLIQMAGQKRINKEIDYDQFHKLIVGIKTLYSAYIEESKNTVQTKSAEQLQQEKFNEIQELQRKWKNHEISYSQYEQLTEEVYYKYDNSQNIAPVSQSKSEDNNTINISSLEQDLKNNIILINKQNNLDFGLDMNITNKIGQVFRTYKKSNNNSSNLSDIAYIKELLFEAINDMAKDKKITLLLCSQLLNEIDEVCSSYEKKEQRTR